MLRDLVRESCALVSVGLFGATVVTWADILPVLARMVAP